MGTRVVSCCFLVLGVMLSTCLAEARGLPLPAPDPERGVIAGTVRGRFPLGQKSPAIQVYFVRVEDDADLYAADSVLPSQLSEKKQVYLLNAKPGRYVAVAAKLKGVGAMAEGDFVAFFDRAAIARSQVEVMAGQVAFMGDLLVDLKTNMSGADDAQLHYVRLIEPAAARKGSFLRAMAHDYLYRAELVEADQTAATATAFLRLGRDEVFVAEPGWKAVMERQLAAAAPP